MKSRLLSLILTLAALLYFSAPANAADGKKGKRAGAGRMLGRFDRNGDGKIDGKEAEHVRGIYSALAALDTDHDGKLSYSEVAAAKVQTGKRKKKTTTQ